MSPLSNVDFDSEFVVTTAAPAPRLGTVRAWSVCAPCVCHLCVPLHGEGDGQHVLWPATVGAPRWPGLAHGRGRGLSHHHVCWVRRPVMAHALETGRRPGRRQAVRLRPELPRVGRLQTGPAPRRSRMNAASVMARDDFLPRRSAGGAAHTWWRLRFLGGGGTRRHQSVVVPPVVRRISHAWQWPMLPQVTDLT